MPRHVLIVEDDADIARLIALHLGEIDCRCTVISDGLAASRILQERHDYHMIILDIMLPNRDVLTLCREIRARDRQTPVLMLTAKAAELDRVLGLELGADDYLTKPFSFLELTARVKAMFRRCESVSNDNEAASESRIALQDGHIDLVSREVHLHQKVISLTAREFDLLVFFARHPGQVFSRSQLLDKVWGYCHEGYEHTVNTHINRLRSKIESNPEKPAYILTVWGVGYQFSRPDAGANTGHTHATATSHTL
ncbi:MAG TPA: DNA-binding response regulator [Gammaproteobacteria bacterium]|jgi:DNA-binding response OmpR family regulator|nr:DNA-binding response regulator [Gammaproteobacteria bacterium]